MTAHPCFPFPAYHLQVPGSGFVDVPPVYFVMPGSTALCRCLHVSFLSPRRRCRGSCAWSPILHIYVLALSQYFRFKFAAYSFCSRWSLLAWRRAYAAPLIPPTIYPHHFLPSICAHPVPRPCIHPLTLTHSLPPALASPPHPHSRS